MRLGVGLAITQPRRVAFSPLDLAPALWLDAADTSTITESGGAVSQWSDKSGNGRHVTQATAANQPTTGSATQNGRNVLSFDGGDRLVASTAATWTFLHDGTDHAIWIVSRRPSSVAAAGLIATTDAGGSRLGLFVIQTDTLYQHLLYGQLNVVTVNNNPTVSTANWQVGQIIADPDNATAANRSRIRVNAGAEQTASTATGGVSGTAPNHAITIGSYGGGGNPLTGDIAEVVIVPSVPSTAQIASMRSYLADKWGITL